MISTNEGLYNYFIEPQSGAVNFFSLVVYFESWYTCYPHIDLKLYYRTPPHPNKHYVGSLVTTVQPPFALTYKKSDPDSFIERIKNLLITLKFPILYKTIFIYWILGRYGIISEILINFQLLVIRENKVKKKTQSPNKSTQPK